ncbi:peroxidase family protein [Deinococcus sp.]|uniref:peroxidase family protein n=1 Tax=Deinococcus sp. TaxID=47478 RepID=UPI003B5CBE53
MFRRASHAEGIVADQEILFSTSFNYLFPEAARSRPCLLPPTETTRAGLKALGEAMADQGSPGDPMAAQDSQIPAAFTYLGQFIDHDLTARTDREGPSTAIGNAEPIVPLDPDLVIQTLRNGRRSQFDLDSVFGDGPGLAGSVAAHKSTSESQDLYTPDLKLRVFESGSRVDLPGRTPTTDLSGKTTFAAVVADMRNDENVNISQLHTAFLKFYNAVHTAQPGSDMQKYTRARQLVRWAYQYIVIHDYLMTVCDQSVVADTLANGPRFYGDMAGRAGAFMPLEFSVAGFRFAHSMIRPFYTLNDASGEVGLLGILGTNGNAANFDPGDDQLAAGRVIQWKHYVGPSAQKARKIDTKIAHDLFTLPFRPADDPVLASLTKSNLFRAFSLSVPTGQAICDGFGVDWLSPTDILTGEDPSIAAAVQAAYFHHRTPLWYYVLREAAVQQGGERLGEVGSRLVAETIIGSIKQDPNSYWNNKTDPAVKTSGIDVKPGAGGVIRNLIDLLKFAGFTGI